MCVGGGTLRI